MQKKIQTNLQRAKVPSIIEILQKLNIFSQKVRLIKFSVNLNDIQREP